MRFRRFSSIYHGFFKVLGFVVTQGLILVAYLAICALVVVYSILLYSTMYELYRCWFVVSVRSSTLSQLVEYFFCDFCIRNVFMRSLLRFIDRIFYYHVLVISVAFLVLVGSSDFRPCFPLFIVVKCLLLARLLLSRPGYLACFCIGGVQGFLKFPGFVSGRFVVAQLYVC